MTEEEALALIRRLRGTSNEITMIPFECGWLAEETLSAQQRAQGKHLGQGAYIIDRSGVVTVQSSLPSPLIMRRYAEARREGRITGRQVWPEPDPTA